ncbi:hypothetical protein K402DRAFT_396638 [Aulographum hederae CBS 113979]|uniref:Uncharacterized protein n=1 Tax=Aulographum hederae CBS 113979 TaxID=1176131 RepID=A0A6G1GRM1_9PEZI|nr:hypothetical protein K402DRAFT_396638 [Aulographum hederae CBS 113979]
MPFNPQPYYPEPTVIEPASPLKPVVVEPAPPIEPTFPRPGFPHHRQKTINMTISNPPTLLKRAPAIKALLRDPIRGPVLLYLFLLPLSYICIWDQDIRYIPLTFSPSHPYPPFYSYWHLTLLPLHKTRKTNPTPHTPHPTALSPPSSTPSTSAPEHCISTPPLTAPNSTLSSPGSSSWNSAIPRITSHPVAFTRQCDG